MPTVQFTGSKKYVETAVRYSSPVELKIFLYFVEVVAKNETDEYPKSY